MRVTVRQIVDLYGENIRLDELTKEELELHLDRQVNGINPSFDGTRSCFGYAYVNLPPIKEKGRPTVYRQLALGSSGSYLSIQMRTYDEPIR